MQTQTTNTQFYFSFWYLFLVEFPKTPILKIIYKKKEYKNKIGEQGLKNKKQQETINLKKSHEQINLN